MRIASTLTLRLGCLLALAVLGCTKATFEQIDSGTGGAGTGGGTAGAGGSSGSGGTTGDAGESGGGGTAGDAGESGSGGTAGVAGVGGSGGTAGSGGGVGGSAAGSGGRGGGVGGSAAGSGGRGGTGGTAGAGGTGGTAGVGGSGGTAGAGGTGGSGGSGGSGGISGSGGSGGGLVTPTVAGQIVITELMHNTATVSDDLGEWFEVYNPSTTVTYDLAGCQVLDSSLSGPVINVSFVLPPMTFKTLAVSPTPGGPGLTPFTPDFVYGSSVKFDNDAGERAGISCNGVEIDEFKYPTMVAGGNGRAFSLDPRHYNAADNQEGMTYWCLARNTMAGDAYETSGPNYGTPGRPNPECPNVTQ